MALLCLTKSFEVISSYTGLGPGGLTIRSGLSYLLTYYCTLGSSHGGSAGSSDVSVSGHPYDKENLASLLGGSGGEFKFFLVMKYSHVSIR